jgi:hypothetical protein
LIYLYIYYRISSLISLIYFLYIHASSLYLYRSFGILIYYFHRIYWLGWMLLCWWYWFDIPLFLLIYLSGSTYSFPHMPGRHVTASQSFHTGQAMGNVITLWPKSCMLLAYCYSFLISWKLASFHYSCKCEIPSRPISSSQKYSQNTIYAYFGRVLSRPINRFRIELIIFVWLLFFWWFFFIYVIHMQISKRPYDAILVSHIFRYSSINFIVLIHNTYYIIPW